MSQLLFADAVKIILEQASENVELAKAFDAFDVNADPPIPRSPATNITVAMEDAALTLAKRLLGYHDSNYRRLLNQTTLAGALGKGVRQSNISDWVREQCSEFGKRKLTDRFIKAFKAVQAKLKSESNVNVKVNSSSSGPASSSNVVPAPQASIATAAVASSSSTSTSTNAAGHEQAANRAEPTSAISNTNSAEPALPIGAGSASAIPVTPPASVVIDIHTPGLVDPVQSPSSSLLEGKYSDSDDKKDEKKRDEKDDQKRDVRDVEMTRIHSLQMRGRSMSEPHNVVFHADSPPPPPPAADSKKKSPRPDNGGVKAEWCAPGCGYKFMPRLSAMSGLNNSNAFVLYVSLLSAVSLLVAGTSGVSRPVQFTIFACNIQIYATLSGLQISSTLLSRRVWYAVNNGEDVEVRTSFLNNPILFVPHFTCIGGRYENAEHNDSADDFPSLCLFHHYVLHILWFLVPFGLTPFYKCNLDELIVFAIQVGGAVAATICSLQAQYRSVQIVKAAMENLHVLEDLDSGQQLLQPQQQVLLRSPRAQQVPIKKDKMLELLTTIKEKVEWHYGKSTIGFWFSDLSPRLRIFLLWFSIALQLAVMILMPVLLLTLR